MILVCKCTLQCVRKEQKKEGRTDSDQDTGEDDDANVRDAHCFTV